MHFFNTEKKKKTKPNQNHTLHIWRTRKLLAS